MGYIKQWFKDVWESLTIELQAIFSDGGVLVIFIVAGLLYPILFNLIYKNGVLEDEKIAVVDLSGCYESREFTREIDATRELKVEYTCASLPEAERLMAERKVKGIVLFPADYGKKLAAMETANISIYADMSSFLYYKNLLMGTNFVMIDNMHRIQIERAEATGLSEREAQISAQPLTYEEHNPYNKTFSYSIFFLSAALLLIVQQTMCYGMSLLNGTKMEERKSLVRRAKNMDGRGVMRLITGRGLAYWLLYMVISIYIAYLVPAMFGFPQRGSFWDIMLLLIFFVTDCVFFSMTWSSIFTKRETVFLLFLCFSPIALFLTGFSWPMTAVPGFWKAFAYIFPTSFACPAYININTAGADLWTVRDLFYKMVNQTINYFFLSFVAVYATNFRIDVTKAFWARKAEKKKNEEQQIQQQ